MQMVDDIFGSMLFRPNRSRQMEEFPSPELLKRRILISTKPPETPEIQSQKIQEEEVESNEGKDDGPRFDHKVTIIPKLIFFYKTNAFFSTKREW